jgi:hypothetical protein
MTTSNDATSLESELNIKVTHEKLKVHVFLRDGRSFWGHFYRKPGERMQDILNDERRFLPFERLYQDRGRASEDIYRTIILAKDAISTVEER